MSKVAGCNRNSEYHAEESTMPPVRWTAPKVERRRKLSRAGDVYAFGISIHEVLSMGAQPYLGLSNVHAIERVRRGERMSRPDSPEDVTHADGLCELMQRCWYQEPGT